MPMPLRSRLRCPEKKFNARPFGVQPALPDAALLNTEHRCISKQTSDSQAAHESPSDTGRHLT